MCSISRQHPTSTACIPPWTPATRVHDSQAYRKTDATRKRISLIQELREILLSFQTGFSPANAAAVCVIPENTSGPEPPPATTESRYLKPVTVPSLRLPTSISAPMPPALSVISLVLPAPISMPQAVEACQDAQLSLPAPRTSSPAKPSMSSAKPKSPTINTTWHASDCNGEFQCTLPKSVILFLSLWANGSIFRRQLSALCGCVNW